MPKRTNKYPGVFKENGKFIARLFHAQVRNGETQKGGFTRELDARDWRHSMLGDLARCPGDITFAVKGGWVSKLNNNGQVIEKSFADLDSAIFWSTTTKVAIRNNTYLDEEIQNITFEQFALDWLTNRVAPKASSTIRTKSTLKNHVFPAIGKMRINELNRKFLQEWVAKLQRAGKSENTIHKAVGAASQVLNAAIEAEVLKTANPCEFLRTPKVPKSLPKAFTVAQVNEIAQLVGNHGLAIRFLAATGLRPAEFAALKVGSLTFTKNPNNDAPEVQVNVITSFSINDKYERILATTKTNQERMIPINSLVIINELKALVAERPSDDWLFKGKRGGALNTSHFHRSVLKPALAKLGLEGYVLYSLRHTFASVMLQQRKVAINVVSKLMGHATVQQTLDTYSHVMGDDAQRAMDGMEVFFEGLTDEERGEVEVASCKSFSRTVRRPSRPLITRNLRVPPTGVEPATHGLGNHCSIH